MSIVSTSLLSRMSSLIVSTMSGSRKWLLSFQLGNAVDIVSGTNKRCIVCFVLLLSMAAFLTYTMLYQGRPLPDLNKEYSLSDPIINPYNFAFLINSERCDSDVQLLIVVHSSTKVSLTLARFPGVY